MLEFETSRLWVRPLSDTDEALYCELFTDAPTMRFVAPPLSPVRATRGFRKYLKSPRRCAAGQLLLAVIEKAGGQPIGICALQQLDECRRRVEAGIMLKPAVHGRGFAKEGLAALVTQAFAVLPVDEVWVQVAVDHAVVERLVISVGFARRGDSATGDEYSAKYVWSVCRESWLRQSTTQQQETINVECHRLS